MSSMEIIGHRGASVQEPENTFASIQRALEECDGAEFDIQRTLDGHLVVLHDLTLARTAVSWSLDSLLSESDYYSLLNVPVTALNYEQFKDVQVGRSHEPHTIGNIPSTKEESHQLSSLPDILDLIKLHPLKKLLIEVKGDIESASLIHRDIVQSGASPSQVKIIGFSFDTMVDLKRLLPSFSSVLICHQTSPEDALAQIDKASKAQLDGIDFLADHKTVTSEVVGKAHMLDMKVLVYVGKEFDNKISWDILQGRGVDIFTSDLPPAVFEWMAEQLVLRDSTASLNQLGKSSSTLCTPKRDISGTLTSRPNSVTSPRPCDEVVSDEFEFLGEKSLEKPPKICKVEC